MSLFNLDLFKTIPLDIGQSGVAALNLKTRQLFYQPIKVRQQFLDAGRVVEPEGLGEQVLNLLEPLLTPKFLVQPTLVTSTPNHTTPVEREVLSQSLYKVGMHKVVVFPSLTAVAIGSGMGLTDGVGGLVMDIGEGYAEIGLVNLGQVVVSRVSFFAGAWLNHRLLSYLKSKYQLEISQAELGRVKRKLLSFTLSRKLEIKGKNLASGKLVKITLDASEFTHLLVDLAERYIWLVESLLQKAPVESVVVAVEKGLILTGGLALIDGLSTYLTSKLDFPVLVAEEAEFVGLFGLASIANNLDEFIPLALS